MAEKYVLAVDLKSKFAGTFLEGGAAYGVEIKNLNGRKVIETSERKVVNRALNDQFFKLVSPNEYKQVDPFSGRVIKIHKSIAPDNDEEVPEAYSGLTKEALLDIAKERGLDYNGRHSEETILAGLIAYDKED